MKAITKSTLAVCFSKAQVYAGLNEIGPVVNMIMWSGIEACASTICANLPCYGPLLKRSPSFRYLFASIRSAFTSPRGFFSRRTPSKNTYQETNSTEGFAKEPGVSYNSTIVEGNIHGSTHEPDIELGQMKNVNDRGRETDDLESCKG